MKKITFLLATIILTSTGFSQTELASPNSTDYGDSPIYSSTATKAPGDSCGGYFNDYISLNKTSFLFVEYMTTGDVSGVDYKGRAQRFHAPQPIEVSGVKFYSYFTEPAVDSVKVYVYLWDWDDALDSIGTQLAFDSCWVTYTAYTAILPDIETIGMFSAPVTVTEDYIVGVIAEGTDDDSLRIYRSTSPDGAGEGVSFAYYDNPLYPGFLGWYQTLATFGAGYDIDYLISPFVKFDLHDGFTVTDDTICPGIVSAVCADYVQMPVFADNHYNGNSASPTVDIVYYWGDGQQNIGLPSACHTYDTSGTYTLNLQDTLVRHNFFSSVCIVDLNLTIVALDTPMASFTVSSAGLTASFTNTSSFADSVVYDFGDGSPTVNMNDPSHLYATIGTYTVIMVAYNECATDTATMVITIDDVGLFNNNKNFRVYPNPANEQIIISGVQEGSQIEIINLLGQTVYISTANSYKEEIDVGNFIDGAYFVRVSGSSDQYTKKILIRH
ncbi:T9SS type A sorting domain-containing protein [Crocinitomix catalasitica]|nr:T9SS type A sorting domain-containing protein [Crocinitomix catalasitica]